MGGQHSGTIFSDPAKKKQESNHFDPTASQKDKSFIILRVLYILIHLYI